jgi:hypothetical protein
MAAFSNYLEDELLDHVLNNNSYASPNPIYVALYTVAPDDTGGGTEVTGGAYARVSLDSSTADKWTLAGGGAGLADNTAAITFPTATANWGTVVSVAILDAATAGNFLLHGALTSSRVVNSGDTFEFAAGDLDITFA